MFFLYKLCKQYSTPCHEKCIEVLSFSARKITCKRVNCNFLEKDSYHRYILTSDKLVGEKILWIITKQPGSFKATLIESTRAFHITSYYGFSVNLPKLGDILSRSVWKLTTPQYKSYLIFQKKKKKYRIWYFCYLSIK